MRILLCTDGSSHGQAALRFGTLIARASPAPATLLGVVEQPGERAQVERALKAGTHLLEGAPAPRIKLRVGHAAEEILAEVTPEAYDLVVVGAWGRRGITRFLLGSTAERVARHAPVSVLIVRGERQACPEPFDSAQGRPSRSVLKRMLLCTAGGEPGLAAVEMGGQVARLTGAQATVLHVMSQVAATPAVPPALLADLEAPAEVLMARNTPEGAHLRQALAILASLGVPAQARVRHGLVVDEILAEGRDGKCDLVVIGAHVAEGLMRFLLDDVTQQIITHIDRPVLVVKMRNEKREMRSERLISNF